MNTFLYLSTKCLNIYLVSCPVVQSYAYIIIIHNCEIHATFVPVPHTPLIFGGWRMSNWKLIVDEPNWKKGGFRLLALKCFIIIKALLQLSRATLSSLASIENTIGFNFFKCIDRVLWIMSLMCCRRFQTSLTSDAVTWNGWIYSYSLYPCIYLFILDGWIF